MGGHSRGGIQYRSPGQYTLFAMGGAPMQPHRDNGVKSSHCEEPDDPHSVAYLFHTLAKDRRELQKACRRSRRASITTRPPKQSKLSSFECTEEKTDRMGLAVELSAKHQDTTKTASRVECRSQERRGSRLQAKVVESNHHRASEAG